MQWHTPLGYRIVKGKVIIDERQKKIVQKVFADYDKGLSATKIANELKQQGVINEHERIAWTHATIGRILEDSKYLGTEYYPQIIEKEMFDRVQYKREETRKHLGRGEYRPDVTDVTLLKGMIVCGKCGGLYSHIQPKSGSQDIAKWKCKNYVYYNQETCAGGYITTVRVKEVCLKAINQIIDKKRLLWNIEDYRGGNDQKNIKFDNREYNDEKKTAEEELTFLYKRASDIYKMLRVRNEEELTQEILDIITGLEKQTEYNQDLCKKLIKQIVIYRNFTVEVIFKNERGIVLEYNDK